LCFVCFSSSAPAPASSTLSLHDALPILAVAASAVDQRAHQLRSRLERAATVGLGDVAEPPPGRELDLPQALHQPHVPDPCDERRSEEHTSELQSPDHLVCRLLLEKKNQT